MTDQLQFYPTPRALADRAWAMFDNPHVRRVLEPSAGRGDLLTPRDADTLWHRDERVIQHADVIEINLAHHATLREKGYTVVDVDFLNHHSPVCYSHIIMNPPFRDGVSHVLHAWSLLNDGELVAILNAETVDNPYTEKRKLLATLIADHGEVEYADEAFMDPDTLRKTAVRVALVHLTKRGEARLPDLSDLLEEDDGERTRVHVDAIHDLALPNNTIQNTVRAFDAAVEAMKRAVIAEASASYYAGLVKVHLSEEEREATGKVAQDPVAPVVRFADVQDTINTRYADLKENAWQRVLRATDFTLRFTNKVQGEIQRQLNDLIKMQFTVANVHAVLDGLLANKTELDMQSLEDAFDAITEFHTGNRVHFRGWKSNDKHRLGWKIRATRFILPYMNNHGWDRLGWEAERKLHDIDRAFALLDGKTDPDYGIVPAAKRQGGSLSLAGRLTSDYFEFRFFKGTGTLHLFPTRPDLIDRLNRVVGRRRQWLPDPQEKVPEAFWLQYDKAEKIAAAIDRGRSDRERNLWREEEEAYVARVHSDACEQLGLPVWNGLAHDGPQHIASLFDDSEAA